MPLPCESEAATCGVDGRGRRKTHCAGGAATKAAADGNAWRAQRDSSAAWRAEAFAPSRRRGREARRVAGVEHV